jgi:hypothetical protein
MRRTILTTVGALTCASFLCVPACEREPIPRATSRPAAAAPTSAPTDAELANVRNFVKESAPPAQPAMPPGHPNISEMSGMRPTGESAPPGTPPVNLKYTAPSTWEQVPVRSSFRAAQFRLPRAEGDAEDGELAVFAAGVGGGVEMNIARWRGQFSTPDDQPLPDDAVVRETMQVGDLKITFIDMAGRFDAGALMAGSSAPAAKDNYRMFGAIVETPSAPWFFKAVGPQATMAHHRDEFVEFLRSMKAE